MKPSYVLPAAAIIGVGAVYAVRAYPGWTAPVVMGLGAAYLWTRPGSGSGASSGGQWAWAGGAGLLAGAAYGAWRQVMTPTAALAKGSGGAPSPVLAPAGSSSSTASQQPQEKAPFGIAEVLAKGGVVTPQGVSIVMISQNGAVTYNGSQFVMPLTIQYSDGTSVNSAETVTAASTETIGLQEWIDDITQDFQTDPTKVHVTGLRR